MSKLIEDFADFSGLRDREVLDLSLAQLVYDLIRLPHVAIYRRVGEGSSARWLTGASLTDGRDEALVDAGRVSFDSLPLLASKPDHEQCMLSGQQMDFHDPVHTMLYPLGAGREMVGVLEVSSREPIAENHRQILSSMSRFYRNLRGLLEENERDALTGLRNRKTFDEAFVRTAFEDSPARQDGIERRSTAIETSGWLAVIDIDHFKRVNDQFGHLIGDEVLLLMAGLMRETFRFNDLIYRFGGEEFVVLMRSASEVDAIGAFERLRARVEGYVFPQVGGISVSIGFTRVCENDTPTDAFDRADQAVYWVKQNGRNQVKSHVSLAPVGRVNQNEKSSGVDFF